MLSCSKCSGVSVYHERSSGKELCEKHFCSYFEQSIREGINLLEKENPKLLVYYSAGKDSTAILYVLRKILNYDVIAATADLGIPEHTNSIVSKGKALCDELGVPYYTVSLKSNLSMDLTDIIQRGESKLLCHYCGELRNVALDRAASSFGVDAVVSGYNKDDMVRFLVNNYLRNDAFRILAFARRIFPTPSMKEKCGFHNPIQLKPLAYLSEKEISLYCLIKNLSVSSCCCGYGYPEKSSMQGWRDDLTRSINLLETSYPGFSDQFIRNFETKLAPIFEKHIAAQDAYLDRQCVWCKKETKSHDTDVCLLCAECSNKIGLQIADVPSATRIMPKPKDAT